MSHLPNQVDLNWRRELNYNHHMCRLHQNMKSYHLELCTYACSIGCLLQTSQRLLDSQVYLRCIIESSQNY